MVKKEVMIKNEPTPKPGAPPMQAFDRLQQSFYYNFNRLQQAQQEVHHAQQMPPQAVMPYANHYGHNAGAHGQPQMAQAPPSHINPGQQPVNRYWSDAMYSLLLRAQQTQHMTDKLPNNSGNTS